MAARSTVSRASSRGIGSIARRRAGFSLVEVAVAAAVLTIAVGGLSSAIISAAALNRVNNETSLAEAAVRRTMERVRGVPFDSAFARFNTDPSDDPAGAGTAPGANFAVTGLEAQPGDADGFVGQITFPTITVAGDLQLREDFADAGLGMPRDLNGDGHQDSADHSADYRLLPVRVRVAWRGVSGVRSLTVESMLSER